MSKIYAEIHIGGKIKSSIAKELINEITSLGLECDRWVEESAYDYIMNFRKDNVLILSNDSEHGRFTLLEYFLAENEVEFSRYTSMNSTRLPEVVHYRKGMKKPEDYISDGDNDILIEESDARRVIRMLNDKETEKAIHFLNKKCGGGIYGLEAFKVVED